MMTLEAIKDMPSRVESSNLEKLRAQFFALGKIQVLYGFTKKFYIKYFVCFLLRGSLYIYILYSQEVTRVVQ